MSVSIIRGGYCLPAEDTEIHTQCDICTSIYTSIHVAIHRREAEGSHANGTCLTYEWATSLSPVTESCLAFEYVRSHT